MTETDAGVRPPAGAPRDAHVITLRPEATGGAGASLLVAGDLCIRQGTPLGDGGHPWEPLRTFIAGHDLSVVNLECPLTGNATTRTKFGPSLAGAPALAAVAREGGFGAASLANNHIMDAGPAGLTDTLAACVAAGLRTVGAGVDLAAAREPLVTTTGTLRVAVVAVAEREFSIAGRGTPGAAPLDPWSTPGLVRALRAEGLLVVVLAHGGNEYYALPRPGLVAACRALADAGAHAVVCHHAHVAGPWEVHRGVPIVYGTGNFLFPARSPRTPAWHRGSLVSLEMDAEGVRELRLVAVEQGLDGRATVTPAHDARAWFAHLELMAATVADPEELEAAWRRFCRSRRPYTLASVLGMTRAERRLLRAGVWPWWRLPRRRVPELYDMVACDSHREVLESALEEDMTV